MAGAEPRTPKSMTAEEFLAWDGGGHVGKLELVHGEVRAMSPASGTHSLIQGNLTGLIFTHIKANGLPCRVATEAPVQPQLHANDNVRAPDVAVSCSKKQVGKTFPEPVLVIEILSPSNRRETWESIHAMASISTLKEIAVVDSEKVHVEVYRRADDGSWPNEGEVSANGGAMRLESISAAFSISDVYSGTHLDGTTSS